MVIPPPPVCLCVFSCFALVNSAQANTTTLFSLSLSLSHSVSLTCFPPLPPGLYRRPLSAQPNDHDLARQPGSTKFFATSRPANSRTTGGSGRSRGEQRMVGLLARSRVDRYCLYLPNQKTTRTDPPPGIRSLPSHHIRRPRSTHRTKHVDFPLNTTQIDRPLTWRKGKFLHHLSLLSVCSRWWRHVLMYAFLSPYVPHTPIAVCGKDTTYITLFCIQTHGECPPNSSGIVYSGRCWLRSSHVRTGKRANSHSHHFHSTRNRK